MMPLQNFRCEDDLKRKSMARAKRLNRTWSEHLRILMSQDLFNAAIEGNGHDPVEQAFSDNVIPIR